VTARRISRLAQAIGTTRNPALFSTVATMLATALRRLRTGLKMKIQGELERILHRISRDLEMLRGSEAKILAKNGDFLERLEVVVTEVLEELEMIRNVTAVVREDAQRHGNA